MSNPKVLIFAPRDEPPQVLAPLEKAGLEIVKGNPDWQWVKADHEPEFIAAARDTLLPGPQRRGTGGQLSRRAEAAPETARARR